MTEIDITIDTLSTQGDGIARHEGKIVFVPFVLPGEQWTVSVHTRKKNFDRALPGKRLSDASPHRVEPACPVFGQCGGCHLQHMDYEHQLTWKRQWLQETFQRIGGLEVECAPVVASSPLAYRNKVTVPVLQQNGNLQLAFHHCAHPRQPVPINDCPIADAAIRAAIPQVNQFLAASKSPSRSRSPRWDTMQIVFLVDDDALHLEWHNFPHPPQQNPDVASDIFARIESLASVRFVRSGKEQTVMRDDDVQVTSSLSFRQVNTDIRDRLYAHVCSLPFLQTDRLLEGYCGTGSLTRMLAQRYETIVAVEASGESVEWAQGQDADSIEYQCATMERFAAHEHESFDTVVMNPPRAGLSEEVRNALGKWNATDVVLISCHPAALARDASALVQQGYAIHSVQPFDMFPQTYHLETVVHFRRSE